MSSPVLQRALIVLALFSAGCASPVVTTTPTPVGPQPLCGVGDVSLAAAASLTVSTADPIALRHAPFARNGAERFAFAQSYETLLNADCETHLYSGLARTWTLDESRTRVTLRLRDGARFWNGDPVRAADVVAAWRATSELSTDVFGIPRRIVDGTTIVDDRTLVVSLPDTQVSVLADPSLVVYRPHDSSAIPEGTGAFRPRELSPDGVTLEPLAPVNAPVISVRFRQAADARDAIDAGADVVLEPDAVAINYVGTRRGSGDPVRLPWTRAYVLAVPRTSAAMPGDMGDAFRNTLARDVVRGPVDATPGTTRWWADTTCRINSGTGAVPSPTAVPRVVYGADDNVARAIAERLAAVSGGQSPAARLGASDFSATLRAGNDLAYVFALPAVSLSVCRDLLTLYTRIPWLSSGRLIPLVDTRGVSIIRRDRLAATIDWDGTLRIGRP